MSNINQLVMEVFQKNPNLVHPGMASGIGAGIGLLGGTYHGVMNDNPVHPFLGTVSGALVGHYGAKLYNQTKIANKQYTQKYKPG